MVSHYLFRTSPIPIFTWYCSVIDALFVHLYSVPSSPKSTSLSFSFFINIPALSATHLNTSANKWFPFRRRCFSGTLMTTDVGWAWDYQQGCEWSRSRAVSISDTSRCSHSWWFIFCLPFLAFLGHRSSFLYYSSLIPFQTRSGLFLVPFPAFLRVEMFFLLANQSLLNVIQVVLTQYFCFIRDRKSVV